MTLSSEGRTEVGHPAPEILSGALSARAAKSEIHALASHHGVMPVLQW
jgi:hypothetical protein